MTTVSQHAPPERWASLIYHEVVRDESATKYFAVPSDRFAAQLRLMTDLGLSLCTVEDAVVESIRPVVALTFDDGLANHYEDVFPLLIEHGCKATFFITSSWIGTPGYATWHQLRLMADAGMSIQSHTATHPFLSELDRRAVDRELATSKAEIEQHLGRACTTLALPGGDAPKRWLADDYASLGYQCVATSRWGPNTRRRQETTKTVEFVMRYTVRRDTPPERLPRLATATEPAYGLEGMRYALVRTLRTTMGPTRYARWRRRALRFIDRQSG